MRILPADCNKKTICMMPKGPVDHWKIDEASQYSLQNWMTDPSIGLMCEPGYMIGLIGSISFISYAFGSLLFMRYNDILGRKLVIQLSGVLTPVGLILLLAL
jgi:MFS family permease